MWLGSKCFPRAQDNDGTDSERFTKPEDRQRVATIAAVSVRDTSGRFINRVLKAVSPSHKRLALSGQSLPFFALCGFRSLEFIQPVFKRCPPGLRIGPQRLGKRQKRCEFCTQLPLILTPGWRPSHMFVQSVKLPTQFPALPSPSGMILIRGEHMIVQRLVNRRGLATDREPQPGDFRDDVGLSVGQQSRIVSPRPTRVKVVTAARGCLRPRNRALPPAAAQHDRNEAKAV